MKRRLIALLQSATGIGLLVWIFLRMKDKSDLLEALGTAAEHWPLLLGAILTFGICVCAVTLRWQYFLHRQGLLLPFGRVLLLYLVGHFFNSFFFGVTGGDVVKAYYAARETRHKKAEAVVTVFVDRAVGLVALVVLAVIAMLVRPRVFLSHVITRIFFVVWSTVLFVCVLLVLVLLMRSPRFLVHSPHSGNGNKFPTRTRSLINRGYVALQLCMKPPALLVKSFLLSLANHVIFIFAAYLLGRSVKIPLGFADYLSVFPVISSVSALPLTPGGTGTREWTSRYFFGLFGVPETRAVTLSLLVYGVLLAWSVIGGVAYLYYSIRWGRISYLELEES